MIEGEIGVVKDFLGLPAQLEEDYSKGVEVTYHLARTARDRGAAEYNERHSTRYLYSLVANPSWASLLLL